jgi:hypothetical protein
MAKIYHAYSATVKRKLLFASPREGGAWRLLGDFDPRWDIKTEVEAAKQRDMVVEVIITDDPVDVVLLRLAQKSKAYHAAGLGPLRPIPVLVSTPSEEGAEDVSADAKPVRKRSPPRNAGDGPKRRSRAKVKTRPANSDSADGTTSPGHAISGDNSPESAPDAERAHVDTPST